MEDIYVKCAGCSVDVWVDPEDQWCKECLATKPHSTRTTEIEALKAEVKALRHRVWSVERALCQRWELRDELEALLGVGKKSLDDQLPIAIAEIKRLRETERKILDRDALVTFLLEHSLVLGLSRCQEIADAVIAYVKEG